MTTNLALGRTPSYWQASREPISSPQPLLGFSPPIEPRAVGPTIESSKQGVRAVRQAIRHLPPLQEGLQWLISNVSEEKRTNISIDLTQLSMDPDGRILWRNGRRGAFWPSRRALEQLIRLVDAPPYAGAYLAAVPPERRAVEFNHIVRVNGNRSTPIVLRIRRHPCGMLDHPEIFAVVSERYTPADPDHVARQILDVADTDDELAEARSEVIYTGTRTSIRIFRENAESSFSLGVDEAFASLLELRLGDDKCAGVNVDVGAMRSLCRNLMLVALDKHGLLRARHVGNAPGLLTKILDSLEEGADLLPAFLQSYRAAGEVRVQKSRDAIEVLSGFTSGKKSGSFLQVAGVKPEMLAKRVTTAWELEGDRTQRGVANAITRAAHSCAWPSVWTSRDLERQGSILLEMPEPRFRRLITPAIS